MDISTEKTLNRIYRAFQSIKRSVSSIEILKHVLENSGLKSCYRMSDITLDKLEFYNDSDYAQLFKSGGDSPMVYVSCKICYNIARSVDWLQPGENSAIAEFCKNLDRETEKFYHLGDYTKAFRLADSILKKSTKYAKMDSLRSRMKNILSCISESLSFLKYPYFLAWKTQITPYKDQSQVIRRR